MIPCLRLIRLEEDQQFGTMGILLIQKYIFCATLEPPDLENAVNVSSIPAQQYWCDKYSSPKYEETFEITNVPGRSKILFHSGNVKDDTAGCILLGEHHGKLASNQRAILNSGNTFRTFINEMRSFHKLHLTIKEVY